MKLQMQRARVKALRTKALRIQAEALEMGKTELLEQSLQKLREVDELVKRFPELEDEGR